MRQCPVESWMFFVDGGGGCRGCGGCDAPPPNLPKGPLLVTKWAKNGIFVRGLRGEVQKVHFWGPKGSHFGVPHLPKIDSKYGPAICIRAVMYLTKRPAAKFQMHQLPQ